MKAIQNNFQNITSSLRPRTKFLAVTKSVGIETIKELYHLGQRDFGENRVGDLLEKATFLKDFKDIHWHFIGNLQRKKVKELFRVPNLKYIHSVDSEKLLNELIKYDNLLGDELGLFLQVNTSGEIEKSGFDDLDSLKSCLNLLDSPKAQNLFYAGLMTMGSIRAEDFEQAAKDCFTKLSQYKDDIDQSEDTESELSMGMSSDYLIADEIGTDWVRIGSALFR